MEEILRNTEPALEDVFLKKKRVFKFLSWLFGHVEKRLDYIDHVNFEIYEVTIWLTNNCNTHIAQYLTKYKQLENENGPLNRIYKEKHFFSEFMLKICREDQSKTSFCFFKKFYTR